MKKLERILLWLVIAGIIIALAIWGVPRLIAAIKAYLEII